MQKSAPKKYKQLMAMQVMTDICTYTLGMGSLILRKGKIIYKPNF